MSLAVSEWLLLASTSRAEPEQLLADLAARLDAAGFELIRLSAWLPTLHPELWGSQLIWSRESGCRTVPRTHEVESTAAYLKSPGQALHAGRQAIRCRLDGPRAELEFPLLAEVAELGATDYFAHVLAADLDRPPWVAFATARTGGFTDSQLAELTALIPLLGLHAQLAMGRLATRSLLEVYLGPNAARQVLAGQFRRGTGTTISAAVWFCDLRGFTGMGDRLPGKELVALLDQYFEAIAGPIESNGGEILKMIGDAALAIFPVDAAHDRSNACLRALAAAEGALAAIALDPRLKIGVALHVGEVVYGNIGGRKRLDFTVIGATVNEVCRVEALCKSLEAPLLMTGAFVAALQGTATVQLGSHPLRGVSEAQPIHTLPRYGPTR